MDGDLLDHVLPLFIGRFQPTIGGSGDACTLF
jgi:hypothetical protein